MSLNSCFYYVFIFNFIINFTLVLINCESPAEYYIPGNCLLGSCAQALTSEDKDNSSWILTYNWENTVSANATNDLVIVDNHVETVDHHKQFRSYQIPTSDITQVINVSNQCSKYAINAHSSQCHSSDELVEEQDSTFSSMCENRHCKSSVTIAFNLDGDRCTINELIEQVFHFSYQADSHLLAKEVKNGFNNLVEYELILLFVCLVMAFL